MAAKKSAKKLKKAKNLSHTTTLSIGSQSSGAGAGKVTFNPFAIVRK